MSEIRVDTISEKTSANGVAVDGLTIKDGGIVGATTITNDDNENTLKLVSTDADQNRGPILTLHRNSGSPADGDLVGIIQFNVQDDAPSEHGLAFISATLSDATAGSEDGILDFNLDLAGTNRSRMTFNATEAVFNDDSQDLDFRVESDGVDKMLFVNGGTNTVSIGGEATPLGRLHVFTADSSASAHANADELVIEGSAYSGMTIASGTSSHGTIAFADSGDELAGRIIYNHSTNAMSFGTAGTGTQWSINSDGNLLPGSSTGQGIHLGVTSAGAANLLDDYEEGTFTPALASTGASFAYTHQKGFYTKVGNAVTFSINFQLDGGGNSFSANAVTITGLPFTSANVSGQLYRFYIFGRLVDVTGTGATGIAGFLNQNSTTIGILESGDNVAGNALNSNQLSSSSGQLFVQGTYYV